MNIFKKLALTVGSTMIVFSLILGGYTIYAQEEAAEYYEDDIAGAGAGFYLVRESYHNLMNGYFNDQLASLVEIFDEFEELEEGNVLEHPDLQTPQNAEDCSDTNLSAFCISMGALDIYIKYLETLDEVESFFIIDQGMDIAAEWYAGQLNNLGEDEPKISNMDSVINVKARRDQEIAEERDDSRAVLDATLSAYNEFMLAYPIHIKNKHIIKNLVKYKGKLKNVRSQVELLPDRFIDATSSDCQ